MELFSPKTLELILFKTLGSLPTEQGLTRVSSDYTGIFGVDPVQTRATKHTSADF
jgi:hypothetical protein